MLWIGLTRLIVYGRIVYVLVASLVKWTLI